MRRFERVTLEEVRHDGDPRVVEGLDFERCLLVQCHVGHTAAIDRLATFRSIRAARCTFERCSLGPVVLEDCRFEDLTLRPGHRMLAALHGAAFVRTTIAGPVRGHLKLEPDPSTAWLAPAVRARNAELYRSAGWALDVSRAELTGIELNGVPARLVRRDPETQVVVTRERAVGVDLGALALGPLEITLERMLAEGWPDVVLVAARRGKRFREELEALRRLRDAGVAEPG